MALIIAQARGDFLVDAFSVTSILPRKRVILNKRWAILKLQVGVKDAVAESDAILLGVASL